VARPSKAVRLDTKAERAKLKQSGTPYYVTVGENLSLGYRKNKKGGAWLARQRADGGYSYQPLGDADDSQPADGVSTLSYPQAQDRARRWGNLAPVAEAEKPLTVAEAMETYLRFVELHRKSHKTARGRTANDILPELGHRRVDQLTTAELRDWLAKLAARPRMRNGAPMATPKTDEEKRKRRATSNRTLAILKAALNFAFAEGRVANDAAWRGLKPFREANAARVHYLQREECRRLVNAAAEPFRSLVNAALLTGCRYSELTRLRVEDFKSESGTVHVRISKSGKGRHVVLTNEGVAFFEALCAGRAGNAVMLTRDGGAPWGETDQPYPMRMACKRAGMVPTNFHALRHTYASLAIMDGVPLMIVARNLGHSDTRMVERHYGHLADDHVSQMIRRIQPLGTVEKTSVVPFAKGAAS
jgi:integrase